MSESAKSLNELRNDERRAGVKRQKPGAVPVEVAVEDFNSGKMFASNLTCGFASGFIVTGLLNPYDRALFLSLMKNRNFLNRKNFTNPYHGIAQTLFQRSLSTGLYFPLEDFFINYSFTSNKNINHILAGNIAGVVNGLLLNPFTYVKYQCWGRDNASFFSQAKIMYSNGGSLVFLRGTLVTCLRDAVFGSVYSVLRNLDVENVDEDLEVHHSGRRNKPILQDMLSAAVGTIISSPLNYVRNIQFYRNSAKSCPSMHDIMSRLASEYHQQETALDKWSLIQHRFRIGWGTLRVAIGMGLASKLYSLCHQGDL